MIEDEDDVGSVCPTFGVESALPVCVAGQGRQCPPAHFVFGMMQSWDRTAAVTVRGTATCLKMPLNVAFTRY